MALLKVKNVGPIQSTSSLADGYIKFNGLTLFIGDQGTGKSTLAKLFSTLSWLEKALFREDFTPKYISQYKRFQKQLEFQNIDKYLKADSYIEYIGDAYTIKYERENLKIKETSKKHKKEYDFPKIMYVPAERNFVSTIDRPDLIKRLPLTIYSFLEEYEYAKRTLNKTIPLPIKGVTFEYRKQNKKSWIIGKDYSGEEYKLDLLASSSGFQSLVPLYLVTESLSNIIAQKGNSAQDELSFERAQKFNEELERILANTKLDEDAKQILIERKLRTINYTSFVNIVEEPEQNLFPTSQKNILYALFKNTNKNAKNKLVLTTHSPYIINYLTLAIKGHELKNKLSKDKLDELNSIVPLRSTMNPDKVSVYQIDDQGMVSELESYKGLPSDENYLNELLGDFNDDFIDLINLEEI